MHIATDSGWYIGWQYRLLLFSDDILNEKYRITYRIVQGVNHWLILHRARLRGCDQNYFAVSSGRSYHSPSITHYTTVQKSNTRRIRSSASRQNNFLYRANFCCHENNTRTYIVHSPGRWRGKYLARYENKKLCNDQSQQALAELFMTKWIAAERARVRACFIIWGKGSVMYRWVLPRRGSRRGYLVWAKEGLTL